MVVIDTSIIIDHLRQPRGQKTALRQLVAAYDKTDLGLSIVTVQELYRGRSTRTLHKEDLMLGILSPLSILPYTYEIAKLGGELMRDSKAVLELADAAIAATAMVNDAQVATLNTKDFSVIKNIKLVDLASLE